MRLDGGGSVAGFVVDVVIDAPPHKVWQLLDDSSSWPSWTTIRSHECERLAGADGLGEIRVFRNGRHVMREQIIERRPGVHLAYTVLAGLAVRDYRADIDLSHDRLRTRVRWETTFQAKVPGTGWLYRRALLSATKSFVRGLAARATVSASA